MRHQMEHNSPHQEAAQVLQESLMPLIQERLAAGQTVHYLFFRGTSMLPMLRQGKDAVELSPLPSKLKKYYLPVYLSAIGQYVMHRIVAVKESCYICLGDNLVYKEFVRPEQMIGVVSAFKRVEKRISVDDFRYRLYCRIWCAISPIRTLCTRCINRLRRLLG